MNGLSFALDGSLKAFLQGAYSTPGGAPILDDASVSETLMEFMSGAKVAYDHNGARLLFIRSGKRYYYEYRLDTQTWHKGDFELFLGSVVVLNSYPDCIIAGASTLNKYVADFTTFLDSSTLLADSAANRVDGLIITRPFDLGEPDIRKTITDIRIRGKFNREDVKYILLGSFDGNDAINTNVSPTRRDHWEIMNSLRGGSYKLFRLVLITHLTPMERISWVDVEFETRMANKLR